ncbi:MAG: outer membrane beta-barrel protein [Spirochaetes bacterium]|nr:outer membrane beta-barrel protein [Spirochaetota bacterium]
MNYFKKYCKFFIILTILLFIPASSYAIVDASVYGGRTFAGKVESGGSSSDVDGWQYGAYAHVNTGIPMVFTVGLGGFYLIAPLKGDVDAEKKTVGIDAYAQIDLPVLPVNPYARYGIAFKEDVEVESTSISENFKSHYFGFGISRIIFSAVKLKLSLFVEYLYTTSKQEKDVKIKGNAVNIGVTAAI